MKVQGCGGRNVMGEIRLYLWLLIAVWLGLRKGQLGDYNLAHLGVGGPADLTLH